MPDEDLLLNFEDWCKSYGKVLWSERDELEAKAQYSNDLICLEAQLAHCKPLVEARKDIECERKLGDCEAFTIAKCRQKFIRELETEYAEWQKKLEEAVRREGERTLTRVERIMQREGLWELAERIIGKALKGE